MHHVFDETPNDKLVLDNIKTTYVSHAVYTNHVGMVSPDHEVEHASVDVSQYRLIFKYCCCFWYSFL